MEAQDSGADPAQASLQSSRAPSGENPKAAHKATVTFADDVDLGDAAKDGDAKPGKVAPAQTEHPDEGQRAQVKFEDVVPVKKEAKKDWVSPFAQSSFQGDQPWHPPTSGGAGTTASAPSAKPSAAPFEQTSVSIASSYCTHSFSSQA